MLRAAFHMIENKQTKEAYDLHLDMLISSLYTLTPPLRKEPTLLEFREDSDKNESDFVSISKKRVILQLNLVKKKHDNIEIEVEQDLADILRESLRLYPRKYLFTDARKFPDFSKKLKSDTVSNRLRKIFLAYGKNIGASILRSSYVTWRFQQVNHELRASEINEMAKLMRTSSQYINTSYKKIFKPKVYTATPMKEGNKLNNAVVAQVVAVENQPVKKEVVIKYIGDQKASNDPYKKALDKQNQRYHNDDDYRKNVLKQQAEYRSTLSNFDKQKRKVVSMLRNSPEYRKSVRPTTLVKYGLDIADYM
jgi:hypothetical protein